ncbi:universal stress protein [Parasphingorhabdus sp.]|uniref:universal stress protein n=1 Tax=Parasphingorhabdus sp. TaxID=2709688 RepID=UPI003266B4B5
MKTILLHIGDDSGLKSRLQVALDLARAHEAHLTCMQPSIQIAPMTYAPMAGHFVADINFTEMQDLERAHREKVEAQLKSEDVPWSWQVGLGDPASLLIEQSGLADLLIVSQQAGKGAKDNDPLPIAGDVAVHAHAATMIVPAESNSFDSTKPIAIAWNGSKEAARAIRFALPALKLASDVHIVTIDEGRELPPLDASTYLSRYGIASNLHQINARKRKASEVIEEFAAEIEASAIVMGAYGHSRLRETLMGGVTRELLHKSRFPLLMGH